MSAPPQESKHSLSRVSRRSLPLEGLSQGAGAGNGGAVYEFTLPLDQQQEEDAAPSGLFAPPVHTHPLPTIASLGAVVAEVGEAEERTPLTQGLPGSSSQGHGEP